MPPQPSLADLTAAAAAADGPSFTPVSQVQFGGVDPLGLRQINFDLMDRVFPALNNVFRHIRPFVVVAWACRRAAELAARQGADRIPEGDLIDFVNRIEVIYAWSQLLQKPDADLPGSQFLGRLLRADRWVFGGQEWKKLCDQRRDSTAFTAAINYGPSLKALGWVEPYARADAPVTDFICHVLESWVLAQHTYWSIGRGLADARARGKSLLRLKVILDEGGWARAPGVSRVAPPVPTADRLGTALSLVEECGLLATHHVPG